MGVTAHRTSSCCLDDRTVTGTSRRDTRLVGVIALVMPPRYRVDRQCDLVMSLRADTLAPVHRTDTAAAGFHWLDFRLRDRARWGARGGDYMSTRITEDALDFALTHIITRSDTDIFPPAFEFNALFFDWDDVKTRLRSIDITSWEVRPHRTCLSPKRGLGFRIATQLDPLDTLMLTALVVEVGADLEAVRVPVEQQIVHSHRFSPDASGSLYLHDVGFDSFRRHSLDVAGERGGFVLITDIADFFPRLYHHPLQNALTAAIPSAAHSRAIFGILRDLTQRRSYGVPVGPSAVRILTEVAIDDVDRALQSEGFAFCRYSDDYRIFTESIADARRANAFLAKTLFDHHGLTLQESKTEIVAAQRFIERFSRSEEDTIRANLVERFTEFVGELREREAKDCDGPDADDLLVPQFLMLNDDYVDIDYDDLDDDQRAVVDSLNLWEILRAQLDSDGALDTSLVRFILRQIANLGLTGDHEMLFANLERLYPVFPYVVSAIASQAAGDDALKVELGTRLLALFDDEVVGHLEYHRAWILSVFAADAAWNHSDGLARVYQQYFDSFTRTEVVLALGAARAAHWFKGKKQEIDRMEPWERRACLAGAACLPGDEAEFWYKSIRSRLDPLEQSIVAWARSQA